MCTEKVLKRYTPNVSDRAMIANDFCFIFAYLPFQTFLQVSLMKCFSFVFFFIPKYFFWFFWLHWVFVAVCGFSLVAVT